MTQEHLRLRLDPEILEQIDAICAAKDTTRTSVISMLLQDALAKKTIRDVIREELKRGA